MMERAFFDPLNALGALRERSKSPWRCKLRPHKCTRPSCIQRVAPAELIAQGNELTGREGLGHLNKYELRGAQGNTWSNLQKGSAWQRHRNLMEANALRRMAPLFRPRENVERALDRGVVP